MSIAALTQDRCRPARGESATVRAMRFLVALSFAILLCLQQATAVARSVEPCCHDDCMTLPACAMAGCGACAVPALPTATWRHAPAQRATPPSVGHPMPGGTAPGEIWRPPQ